MKTNGLVDSDLVLDIRCEEISEKFMKKMFFECEKCDGALVQLATCIVCKRTAMRICVNCTTVLKIPHESCGIIHSNNHLSKPILGSGQQC